MSKRLYVGNLPYSATEQDIEEAFKEFDVTGVTLPMVDGRPKGFGFVDVGDDQAEAAIAKMNGSDMGGRTLTVNEARPREERGPRNGGGYQQR